MDYNMSMVRGDTMSFGMELPDLNQDLDSAFFTVRKSYDGEIVLQKSIGNGISKVDENQYAVRVAPEDTKDIDGGKYYYDVEIGANSDIFTVMKGVLDIEYDVTLGSTGKEEEEDADMGEIVAELKVLYARLGGTDDVSNINSVAGMIRKLSDVIAGDSSGGGDDSGDGGKETSYTETIDVGCDPEDTVTVVLSKTPSSGAIVLTINHYGTDTRTFTFGTPSYASDGDYDISYDGNKTFTIDGTNVDVIVNALKVVSATYNILA